MKLDPSMCYLPSPCPAILSSPGTQCYHTTTNGVERFRTSTEDTTLYNMQLNGTLNGTAATLLAV